MESSRDDKLSNTCGGQAASTLVATKEFARVRFGRDASECAQAGVLTGVGGQSSLEVDCLSIVLCNGSSKSFEPMLCCDGVQMSKAELSGIGLNFRVLGFVALDK
mmetsp:Transcript_27690/g.57629  ORF Transcript_27690/g.57629 Transcript_27690/m.57629 type:complete len:105 (-) Transcript_27690:2904-3218(-)